LKHIAGDGDRLPDLAATISELRHCPTFAAPGASSSSNVRVGVKTGKAQNEQVFRFAAESGPSICAFMSCTP
jgi:hypothetical protein